jgi:hypothetical protein
LQHKADLVKAKWMGIYLPLGDMALNRTLHLKERLFKRGTILTMFYIEKAFLICQ